MLLQQQYWLISNLYSSTKSSWHLLLLILWVGYDIRPSYPSKNKWRNRSLEVGLLYCLTWSASFTRKTSSGHYYLYIWVTIAFIHADWSPRDCPSVSFQGHNLSLKPCILREEAQGLPLKPLEEGFSWSDLTLRWERKLAAETLEN